MELSKLEIKDKLHDITRQFFTRHKDEFNNWGDALHWLHTTEFEKIEKEAGSLEQSDFRTDILWLISLFGPNVEIDWDVVHIRKVPSVENEDPAPKEATEIKSTQIAPQRRQRRRRRC